MGNGQWAGYGACDSAERLPTTVGRDTLMHDDTYESVAVVWAVIVPFRFTQRHISIPLCTDSGWYHNELQCIHTLCLHSYKPKAWSVNFTASEINSFTTAMLDRCQKGWETVEPTMTISPGEPDCIQRYESVCQLSLNYTHACLEQCQDSKPKLDFCTQEPHHS
jgi:hypothetical protein